MLYSNLPYYRRASSVRPRPLEQRAAPRSTTGQKPIRSVTRGIPVRPPVAAAAPNRLADIFGQLRARLQPSMLIVFVVAIVGFVFVQHIILPGIGRAFSSLTTSSEEKSKKSMEARMETYADTVNKLIAARPGANIAVSTYDLSDGSSKTLGDPGTFTAASTAKLITAITLLHQSENDGASLSRKLDGVSAGDHLRNMIVDSDNDAWQRLNDYVTHDNLQAYMASLGWTEYDPEINTLLPADMARLMAKLYEGKLLSREHTDLLLGYMQDANKQEYIVDAVPDGYRVYHKAGWLDGLMHDVAIISDGKKTIALAIYTFSSDEQGDSLANEKLFAAATRAAVKAYFEAD